METVPERLYVLQDGERTGPFPRQQVLQMLEFGSITPSTFVWAKGMADWVALETIMDELAAAPEQSMPARPQAVDSTSQATATFGGVIAGAFAFPFRGFGWATILTGSILLTGIEWFGMLPAAPGILMLFLGVTAWGYILLMLQAIIQRTAMGDSTEPEWPDFDGFGQLIGKFFQWVVILAVCFGPASILGFKLLSAEDGMPGATGLIAMAVLYIAGASYFPMALLGVAVFDTLGALNPMLVARSIFKVPGHYFVVLLIFGGLLGCSLLVSMLTLYVPIIGTLLYQFYSLWGLMFLAKILGGLYAFNSEKLGWI